MEGKITIGTKKTISFVTIITIKKEIAFFIVSHIYAYIYTIQVYSHVKCGT